MLNNESLNLHEDISSDFSIQLESIQQDVILSQNPQIKRYESIFEAVKYLVDYKWKWWIYEVWWSKYIKAALLELWEGAELEKHLFEINNILINKNVLMIYETSDWGYRIAEARPFLYVKNDLNTYGDFDLWNKRLRFISHPKTWIPMKEAKKKKLDLTHVLHMNVKNNVELYEDTIIDIDGIMTKFDKYMSKYPLLEESFWYWNRMSDAVAREYYILSNSSWIKLLHNIKELARTNQIIMKEIYWFNQWYSEYSWPLVFWMMALVFEQVGKDMQSNWETIDRECFRESMLDYTGTLNVNNQDMFWTKYQEIAYMLISSFNLPNSIVDQFCNAVNDKTWLTQVVQSMSLSLYHWIIQSDS